MTGPGPDPDSDEIDFWDGFHGKSGTAVIQTGGDGVVRVSGIGSGEYEVTLVDGTWVPVFSSDERINMYIRPGEATDCHAGHLSTLIRLSAKVAVAQRGTAAVIGSDQDAMCESGPFSMDVSTASAWTRWGLELGREPVAGWGTGGAAALDRADVRFVQIDAASIGEGRPGEYLPYVCGVRSDGGAECWGPGFGDRSEPRGGMWTQVAASEDRVCGLEVDSTVTCWEWPTMHGVDSVEQISIAGATLCGLKLDRSLVCQTTASVSLEPPSGRYVQVEVHSTAKACAIKDDGTERSHREGGSAPGVMAPACRIACELDTPSWRSAVRP